MTHPELMSYYVAGLWCYESMCCVRNSTYVAYPVAIFDNGKNLLNCNECDVVWGGDIVSGAGVASYSFVCAVVTPLSTVALSDLLELLY